MRQSPVIQGFFPGGVRAMMTTVAVQATAARTMTVQASPSGGPPRVGSVPVPMGNRSTVGVQLKATAIPSVRVIGARQSPAVQAQPACLGQGCRPKPLPLGHQPASGISTGRAIQPVNTGNRATSLPVLRSMDATPTRGVSVPALQPRTAATQAVVQRIANGAAFPLPANLANFGSGNGQSLPESVRHKMESFFKTSFADVRVHVGPQASSIGALAFTHGSNLYFAPGQYDPNSTRGQQLLGHELTHVVQQRNGRVRNPFGSGIAVVQDQAMEAEAERTGMRAAMHQFPLQAKMAPVRVNAVRTSVPVMSRRPHGTSDLACRTIQRADDDDDEDYVPSAGRRQTLMGSTPKMNSALGRIVLRRWHTKTSPKARYTGSKTGNARYSDIQNWEVFVNVNGTRKWVPLNAKYVSKNRRRPIAKIHMGHKLAAARYYQIGAASFIKRKLARYAIRYALFKKAGKLESESKRKEFMKMPDNYRFEYYTTNTSAGSGGYTYD